MSLKTQENIQDTAPLPTYESILLAVDSSEHSDRGIQEAVGIAGCFASRLTAVHVYAAKLHDARFRQMEAGLPEQFRQEQELEHQRDVHDDLITRGLSIITDSHLDQVEKKAEKKRVQVRRRSLEGKNYRELVNEANNGNYDLLVMGALGLGAVQSSRIGTVCQRVVRRTDIDTLVIKDPTKPISDGPIVVAIDGSSKAYGGLLTAFALAREWRTPVKVVSAFDPYYHYVAFNRIAGVLSEQAGRLFKFKQQEKLHEEIIDSGLAKIYQGHLSVASSIAADYEIEIETALLDGKPHDVIARYLREVKPSLLIVGTTGVHADPELDIGGNSEQLLNNAECAVLLSQREHRPRVDRLASVNTSWTIEAEERMENVPSFVRPMARMAITRYAQEQGHTVITGRIVDEARARLMPGGADQAMEEIVKAYDRGELKTKPETEVMRWSDEATQLLLSMKELSLRGNLSMRAEKKARTEGVRIVAAEHIRPFIEQDSGFGNEEQSTAEEASSLKPDTSNLTWQAAALARLMRVPQGFMRDRSKQRIESYAHKNGLNEITLEVAETGLADARQIMEQAMKKDGAPDTLSPLNDAESKSSCPFAGDASNAEGTTPITKHDLNWSPDAESMLNNVPAGFCRDMTCKATETIARQSGQNQIDSGFISKVMETFKHGSEAGNETMPWDETARQRIAKAPDMVRGMLIREIEGWSRRNDLIEVTEQAVDAIKKVWAERGLFHLDPNDPRNR